MNREAIEQSARRVQIEIYRHRDSLFSGVDLPPIYQMFTPAVAASVLGVTYEVHPGLGGFGNGENRFEVAGLLDRNAKKIAVSERFSPIVQRFTGGHEVGHWELHKSDVILHRDRQLTGLAPSRAVRSQTESEADYFSACYLVQRNVAKDQFEARFGPIDHFRFNDAAAFGLCPSNSRSLIASSEESLDWELALASAIRYHNTPFESLADLFLVSPTTMAIRLREIGLRRH